VKQAVLAAVVACLAAACGRKGPPLPPLVRLPVPPDVQANRRGSSVELAVVVPGANADGSRPANISRVEIYALTGSPTFTDADLLKHGTRVANIPVKSPRNPDDIAEPDEPLEEVEAPTGTGLDQGAGTTVRDALTAAALVPVDVSDPKQGRGGVPGAERPLLGVPSAPPVRTYVGVGVNTKGRRGRFSRRAPVSLAPPPVPPAAPTITYTETAITVAWTPAAQTQSVPSPASGSSGAGAQLQPEALQSRPLGPLPPPLSYNVYDATTGALLTMTPISEPRFVDARVEFGAERCYGVRAVDRTGGLSVESDAREPQCIKLVDTFPPAPPKDLKAVSTEGVISLIWDANAENDLAGYIILRGPSPGDRLEPVVPMPVLETSFNDNVPAGTRYVYAVQAVDKAGNASAPSNRVEETAR
jgi:predicted small lipoprotein YifL